MIAAVSLTGEQFRYSFGNAISQAESDDLHERWAIPAPDDAVCPPSLDVARWS